MIGVPQAGALWNTGSAREVGIGSAGCVRNGVDDTKRPRYGLGRFLLRLVIPKVILVNLTEDCYSKQTADTQKKR